MTYFEIDSRRLVLVAALLCLLSGLIGCAQVGSRNWCSTMKAKPAVEWTIREIKDYSLECAFRADENEEKKRNKNKQDD